MITLGTIKSATGHEAITAFVEERVLPGTDWNLVKVRRKSIRLEPPHAYWATYRVRLGRGDVVFPDPVPDAVLEPAAAIVGGAMPAEETVQADAASEEDGLSELAWSEERELRLVARGAFDPGYWGAYRKRIVELYGDRACDPLGDYGFPIIFDETQHVIWFYPIDPNLHGLWRSAQPDEVLQLFRNHTGEILDHRGRCSIKSVNMELAKYVPEISAIIRYDIEAEPASASKTIFGKVQPGNRGAESNRIMTDVWHASKKSEGRLVVPRPRGYHHPYGLFLQDAVSGSALGSDRTKAEFLSGVLHAADALVEIHDSGITTEKKLPLEGEIGRLDRTLDQFALVHPKAYFLLRELLIHVRDTLKRLPGEEWLPTHGDYKYDQLLHNDGEFSLIDFDYFAIAETSFDVAKFCAYIVPSMPIGWEHSMAAESGRTAFLERYRERRRAATLQRFPVYEAVNLGGRAMTMMWVQAPGWDKAAETLLVMAMERLNSRAP